MPRAPQMREGDDRISQRCRSEIGVEQTLTRVKIREIKKVLLDGPGGLQEWRGVVEDEVDTGPASQLVKS